MIKDMEVECKTKFSMDVEFSFSFKRAMQRIAGFIADNMVYYNIDSYGIGFY